MATPNRSYMSNGQVLQRSVYFQSPEGLGVLTGLLVLLSQPGYHAQLTIFTTFLDSTLSPYSL